MNRRAGQRVKSSMRARSLLRLWPVIALVVVIGAAALIAGGGSGDEPAASTDASRADAGGNSNGSAAGDLPRALAENADRAGELEDGALDALDSRLAALQGHPVVVNQWGSWCPPCRAEFPFFAESAQQHQAELAFLGVDIQDNRGAAEGFLTEFPTPYPHVFDPDLEAVDSLEWRGVSPTTWFIDKRGEIVHQRPGAYATREELEADIDRYLPRA